MKINRKENKNREENKMKLKSIIFEPDNIGILRDTTQSLTVGNSSISLRKTVQFGKSLGVLTSKEQKDHRVQQGFGAWIASEGRSPYNNVGINLCRFTLRVLSQTFQQFL